jgi:hypothetical protein
MQQFQVAFNTHENFYIDTFSNCYIKEKIIFLHL